MMKSERRHELEKNELADRLATGIESTRSFLPLVLGGLGVLAVLAIVWGLYSTYSKKNASVAWTEFYFNLTAGDADSFVDLANDYPSSAAAGWARQIAGDNYLQRGIAELYRNKSEGQKLIGQAIDAFEDANGGAANPELRAKALLGLAQAHESLGETDKAAGYYQQVAKAATQPGLVNSANQRLAFLTSDSGKEFYAWFKKLDPKPDAPIVLPSDMSLPPMTPDLQFGPTDPAVFDATSSVPAAEQTTLDPADVPPLPTNLGVPTGSTAVPDLPAVPTGEPPATELPPVALPPVALPAAELPPGELPAADVPATGGLELKP